MAIKDHNGKLVTDPIERPTPKTLIMHLYSVVNVIFHKFNQQNQVNPSPLVSLEHKRLLIEVVLKSLVNLLTHVIYFSLN